LNAQINLPTADSLTGLFRQQMPVTQRWAYFDHAAVAPIPLATQAAVVAWAQEATREGDVVWGRWSKRVEEIRRLAATLVNARPEEIAFVPNTTSGISIVAEGYPWRAGDNLVTLENEFPSNLYPWMNLQARGVETRRVPVDVRVEWSKLAQACDGRTRLLAISWVGYSTGWRVDLQELVDFARQRSIHVMLDAIQGLGVFPLDVRQTPIDFFAADGHKWLLGPEGAGLLYVRQDLLDMLRPTNVGWHSVAHSGDFTRIELTLRPAAARFEGGSQNMVGVLGLGASLELLASLGLGPQPGPIAQRVLAVTQEACERLQRVGAIIHSQRPEGHGSGIVSFDLPGRDLPALRLACLQAGVVLSCRGGRLRISPHAYCNSDDLERLVEALRDAGRTS
jgi:selenocysteine lyase/cysteine desulfurase